MAANTFVIGNYDREASSKKILEDFQKMLDKSSEEIKKFREELLSSKRDDVCLSYMKAKDLEAKELQQDIDNFRNRGEHFTKEYRTFQGHCGKLQTDLDGVDVLGRKDLHDLRKKVLENIDKMIKTLQGKVHQDGKPCNNCPVKK